MKNAWLALLIGTGGFANTCDIVIDPYRELVIVNPLVVENSRANSGGPWHFASLLSQMLPAESSQAGLGHLMERWLSGSKAATQVNGFSLSFPGFALGERSICRWLDETGRGACAVEGLNPERIPYKLLAIVNRIDLQDRAGDVAEGRFVFGALTRPTDKPATDPTAHGLPETVIFEYALPLTTRENLKQWADRWHLLSSLDCNTDTDCEPFRQRLEEITRSFSSRAVMEGKPNGNAIRQIRTSHLAFGSSSVWSFRQFVLEGNVGAVALTPAPTSQSPHHGFDGQPNFLDVVRRNAEMIRAEKFLWPREWLGGEALIDESKVRPWYLDGVDEELRQSFSVQTCNGCHNERSVVDGFFHISPVATGPTGKERLSKYLTDDEIPKRSEFMKNLLCR